MGSIVDRIKWAFHPVLVFIFCIVALATSLVLYIYWYVEVSTGLKRVVINYNLDPSQFLEFETWVVILVLSILVGIILIGIFIIFAYNQKTLQLYRLQYNFINNFTHELKTPVTSLNLYLQTFIKHELSRRDQLNYLEYMLKDVERLSGNINRILDIAKIESKSYGGEYVESDIVEIIEQFYQSNSQIFRDCEIAIHAPKESSFFCRINYALFEILLMNLLINAVKYNESKTPKIDITFEPQKRKLLVRFADNGIGIEGGEIKKIFKKFYQSGQADNMTAKGSGLGLYLVQVIARFHKGKVVAESKGPGKGSVFTLRLPYKHQP